MNIRPRIKNDLLTFIGEELVDSHQASVIQSDEDLLTSDLLDSLAVMRLVAFIEEKIGSKIPVEDITIEHFISVDAICDYLADVPAP